MINDWLPRAALNLRTGTVVAAIAAAVLVPASVDARPRYTGINLAGGEFNSKQRPGVYAEHYVYPSEREIGHFASLGMNAVRLPVRWERIQHRLAGPLHEPDMRRIDGLVAAAERRRMLLILDLHNYARYGGRKVEDPEVAAGLADVWRRLATRYRGRQVAFGIMNEPMGLPAPTWRRIVDPVVTGIRGTGAKNLLLIPGSYWTGAHSWTKGKASNGEAFRSFRDPGGNFAFEMHQYLDGNSSGASPRCVSAEIGAQRLKAATSWLRQVKAKGFLGEFGVGRDPVCLAALERMLAFMDANSDAWLGWTYWAAGPWWKEDYEFSVQPDGVPKPQIPVLVRYARGAGAK